jgi:hypothetical protein
MKKKSFVKLINAIIRQNERDETIINSLNHFDVDGMFIFDITNDIKSDILYALEVDMDDPYMESNHGSLISWWLYDAPNAGKSDDSAWIQMKDGTKIPLETPEQLYNYLINDKGE